MSVLQSTLEQMFTQVCHWMFEVGGRCFIDLQIKVQLHLSVAVGAELSEAESSSLVMFLEYICYMFGLFIFFA